jgi:glycosyltransferase involved in cell wall biosynthesis
MKRKPKVSVIIPTYNRNKVLTETIESVLSQKFKSFELIIVDQSKKHNKQTTGFLNNMKDKRFSYYKISPPSLPAARNFGLKKALGDVVIYIDDDVILDDGFIKAHYESYIKYKAVAVVGRIKEKNKPVSDKLLFLRKTSFGAGNFNYPNFAYAETAQGCNMSYKKSLLKKIGGFDTNFIGNAMREESDVSFKIRKMGKKILYNPKASLFHKFYKSGGCREKTTIHDNYIIYRNEIIFFLRHRPLVYFPYFFAGHFFKYVLNRELIAQKLFAHRFKVFVKGLTTGTIIFFFPKKPIIAREVN